MKVLDFEPENVYTCQGCKREFISLEILFVEQEIQPVCSKRCEFIVIYRLIKNLEYDDKTLELFQKVVENKDKIGQFERNKAIYSITKYFGKMGLSSIKHIGTKGQDKKTGDKKPDLGTKGQDFPPYVNRGNCPCLVPTFSFDVPKSLSLSGGLRKWF